MFVENRATIFMRLLPESNFLILSGFLCICDLAEVFRTYEFISPDICEMQFQILKFQFKISMKQLQPKQMHR